MSSNGLQAWRSLFTVAEDFYALAPWEWIYDSHTFSVSSSIDGQTYYCSLMGNHREVFGINFYPGDAGFMSMRALYDTNEGQESPPLAGFEQLCLHLEFEHDGTMFRPEDVVLFQGLGFDWQQKGYGIVLNDMQPGLVPQIASAEQAQLVTELLSQALQFVQAYRGKTSYLEQLNSLSTMVAVQTKEEGVDFEVITRPEVDYRWETTPLAELTIRSIAELPQRSATNIMMIFYTPGMVADPDYDRPFFSLAALWMDADSGQIITLDNKYPDELRAKVPQWMTQQFSQQGYRPTRIAVNEKVVAQAILPACKEWDFNILISPPQILDDLYFMLAAHSRGDDLL